MRYPLSLHAALFLSFLFFSSSSEGQDTKSIVEYARNLKVAIEKIESDSISKGSCAIPGMFTGEGYISKNNIVIIPNPKTTLKRGDEIIFFDRTVLPGQITKVRVLRNGEELDVPVLCSSAKDIFKEYLAFVNYAIDKNWKKCVSQYDVVVYLDGPSLYGFDLALVCSFKSTPWADFSNARANYLNLIIQSLPFLNESDRSVWRKNALIQIQQLRNANQNILAADYLAQLDRLDALGSSKNIPDGSHISKSTGTCAFIADNGLAVTSHHVIDGAKLINITIYNGDKYSAKVIQSSENTDLALLKINPKGKVAFIPFESKSKIDVGVSVFTYGFPMSSILGAEPKYTEGVISALSGIGNDSSLFQMTTQIQPGNSGGPVVSFSGNLVGIVASTAAVDYFIKRSGGALPQNINWAVKAEYIKPLLTNDVSSRPLNLTKEQAIKNTREAICFVEVES